MAVVLSCRDCLLSVAFVLEAPFPINPALDDDEVVDSFPWLNCSLNTMANLERALGMIKGPGDKTMGIVNTK